MPQTISTESTSTTAHAHAPQRELATLLASAGVFALPETGWIRVAGEDRVRWLNGMVTNSIQDLAPGMGCYNFFLNAQGRIQGDGTVFAQVDDLLLETSRAQLAGLLILLDRFIIMDDVELSDVSASRKGLLVAGPRAADVLEIMGATPAGDGKSPRLVSASWRSHTMAIIQAHSPLVARFEVWVEERDSADALLMELKAELVARGAVDCSPDTLDLLRIAEGTPLFGVDIRDRDLPQETGADRALHFAKGCYLGQEIVERIRSRGNVHRTFHGFRLESGNASAGAVLTAEGKSVGELTSVAELPAVSGELARVGLGYVRREALALGKRIECEGGTAKPVSLPFDRTDDPLTVKDI